METETQLHPELASQVGISQEQKKYDIHPSLQTELEPEEQPQPIEQTIQTEPSVAVEEPVEPQDPKERNWRELRAQAERSKQIEREYKQRDEAHAREIEFYRQQALNKQQEPDDDYRTESEKKLERQMEELRQQVAKNQEETNNANRRAAVSQGENRLLQDYPDIREIVSDENIKRLEYEYPHLYNSVIASSDVYAVGSTAYELILAKGIAQRKATKIQQQSPNRNMPRSASTVAPQAGETPIQRAGNFMGNTIASEDERKALYQEMISSSRNRL
jgi:hypothetical protein